MIDEEHFVLMYRSSPGMKSQIRRHSIVRQKMECSFKNYTPQRSAVRWRKISLHLSGVLSSFCGEMPITNFQVYPPLRYFLG